MATMFLFLELFLSIVAIVSSLSSSLPNIVVIMVDDLGWGNVGYHNRENHEIQTPHIDNLVQMGIELDRHYVWPGCTPSRSAFQSGRLPVHVTQTNDDGIADPRHGVPINMKCIASKLKEASYSTHMIGKWDIGQATFDHLPTALNRGYDTYFGYLGKNVNYYDYSGDNLCGGDTYYDLWENGRALTLKDVSDDISNGINIEDTMANKMYDLIDQKALEDNPFFIVYSSHLPHYPTQVPKSYYIKYDDDESQCTGESQYLYPGYDPSEEPIRCRSAFQGMVRYLDDIVGNIVDRLKSNDLWDNTLLLFTSDNGGSLELEGTAANNYPLRGGKSSSFEGGILSVAFVSGGYLPKTRRGEKELGLMHIADWYVTFCGLAGLSPSDTYAVEKGLPDVDGYDLWPLLSGETDLSPRLDVAISNEVFIYNQYKLIIGTPKLAIWGGILFPNASTETYSELEAVSLACNKIDIGDNIKKSLCLFDVVDDKTEHIDIALDNQDLAITMYHKFTDLEADFYDNDDIIDDGTDACPNPSVYLDAGWDYCSCWVAFNNYDSFMGPYQNLDDEHINWEMDLNKMDMKVDILQTRYNNVTIVIAMCAALIVLFVFLTIKIKSTNKKLSSIDNTEKKPLLNQSKQQNVMINAYS